MCLTRPAAAFEQQPRHFGIAFYRRAEPLAQIDRWLSRRCLPERREAARPEPLTDTTVSHELCDALLLLLRLVLGTERDAGKERVAVSLIPELSPVVAALVAGVHGVRAPCARGIMRSLGLCRLCRQKKPLRRTDRLSRCSNRPQNLRPLRACRPDHMGFS